MTSQSQLKNLTYSFNQCKRGLAVLIIAGQLAGIVVGRFVPERYFCWAPFEETSVYEIEASWDGKPLSEDDILNRYSLSSKGRNNRSIHHVISIIRWREERSTEPVAVRVRYWTNGGEEQRWIWPEDS